MRSSKEIRLEIDKLQEELERAEDREDMEMEERRRRAQKQYLFTIHQISRPEVPILDPSCSWWRLNGEVTNKDELVALGYGHGALQNGHSIFLFNHLSKSLVMQSGGATVWIPWNQQLAGTTCATPSQVHLEAARVYKEIGEFIDRGFPFGGDVTSIITSQKYKPF